MGVTQPYVRPLIRVMANEFLNSLGWDFRMVAVRTIRLGVIPSAQALRKRLDVIRWARSCCSLQDDLLKLDRQLSGKRHSCTCVLTPDR